MKLATRLRENGIDATLDQWDLRPGGDLIRFMEKGVGSSDRVLMIFTEGYVKKAEGRMGGVGYENMVAKGEIASNLETDKFIPLLRSEKGTLQIPGFLGTRVYIDFSDDDKFEEQIRVLVHELYQVPLSKKPELGKNPFDFKLEDEGTDPSQEEDAVSTRAGVESKLDPASNFMFTAWLNSGGDTQTIKPYLMDWLMRFGNCQEAVFVFKSWLDSGNNPKTIEPFVMEWLIAFRKYSGS